MSEELLQAYKNTLDAVAEMRRLQKQYFKTKKPADLIEAKRMEQAVDMRLTELGLERR